LNGWRRDNFALAAAATAFRDGGCTFFWVNLPFRTVILKKSRGKPLLAAAVASLTMKELQRRAIYSR
jgi:hypothetical protein